MWFSDMLCLFRPSFEVVKEGRILTLSNGGGIVTIFFLIQIRISGRLVIRGLLMEY
jgi:hypothetical protein